MIFVINDIKKSLQIKKGNGNFAHHIKIMRVFAWKFYESMDVTKYWKNRI